MENNSLELEEKDDDIIMRDDQSTMDLNFEQERLNTFTDKWKIPYIEPKALAKNGFYYIESQDNDCVQCNFCKIMLYKWEEKDDVVMEHYRASPDCIFLKQHISTANISIGSAEELNNLLAPIRFIDHTKLCCSANRYIHVDALNEGYYAIKRIRFIVKRDGETRVRIDLKGERKYTIFDLNCRPEYENLSKDNLEKLSKVYKNFVIMRVYRCENEEFNRLQFYETEKCSLYYQSSRRIEMKEMLRYKSYKVLLFSIVKIGDEYRTRVDIEGNRHFILPHDTETMAQEIKTFEDLERWNNKRLRVVVSYGFRDLYDVRFCLEKQYV